MADGWDSQRLPGYSTTVFPKDITITSPSYGESWYEPYVASRALNYFGNCSRDLFFGLSQCSIGLVKLDDICSNSGKVETLCRESLPRHYGILSDPSIVKGLIKARTYWKRETKESQHRLGGMIHLLYITLQKRTSLSASSLPVLLGLNEQSSPCMMVLQERSQYSLSRVPVEMREKRAGRGRCF